MKSCHRIVPAEVCCLEGEGCAKKNLFDSRLQEASRNEYHHGVLLSPEC